MLSLTVRTKYKVHDMKRSDREVFHSLPLNDVWHDAELIPVWVYLYKHPKTSIPDSWLDEMATFHEEMMKQVPDETLIDEYNMHVEGHAET